MHDSKGGTVIHGTKNRDNSQMLNKTLCIMLAACPVSRVTLHRGPEQISCAESTLPAGFLG